MPYKKPLCVQSLILGIAAVVGSFPTLGIAGIVCGIVGIVLARKYRFTHRTRAGFILSLIGLILGVVIPVAFIVIIAVGTQSYQELMATMRDE